MTLWADPPESTVAGNFVTYNVYYMPRPKGIIEIGSRIQIYQSVQNLSFESRYTTPQVEDPKSPGYISACRSDGGDVRVSLACDIPGKESVKDYRVYGGGIELTIEIMEKPLKYPDYVQITFGDKSQTDIGFPYPAFTYPGEDQQIWAFGEYSTNGGKKFYQDEFPVKLPITPAPIHRFLVNSPSEAMFGEDINFEIIPVDRFRNPASFCGKLEYYFSLNGKQIGDSATIDADIAPYEKTVINYKPDKEGVLRLHVKAETAKGDGFPIKVTKDKPKFHRLWGDLHVHTFCSDGYGTAENALKYARDILGHQWIACADHDNGLGLVDKITGKTLLQLYLETVGRIYEPGIFTVILGNEYTGRTPANDGHRNLYVADDKFSPFVRERDFKTPSELIALAHEKNALLFVHQPIAKNKAGTDWKYHDERVERLVEIHAGWGCSERADSIDRVIAPSNDFNAQPVEDVDKTNDSRSVISALNKGLHIGFVAGSDEHSGRASNVTFLNGAKVGSRSLIRRSGTTCVMSGENSRKEIFSNLYNRNCYAVSGEDRMLIDFSVNGTTMGKIGQNAKKERVVEFSVSAVNKIARIDIVKNGQDYKTFKPDCLDYAETVTDESPEGEEDYYYLRVTTCLDDMGWSSPVWVQQS